MKSCGSLRKSLLASLPHSSPTCLLAVIDPGQRVIAARGPLDRVVDIAHRALGVAAAERGVGVTRGLLVLLRTHSCIPFLV